MERSGHFAGLGSEESAKLVRTSTPEWVVPMKDVLTEQRFTSDEWIYERKLDGIRCLAFKRGREVRLLSRNKLSLNVRFAEIASALREAGDLDCVLDGEVAAFAGGETSFERLQQRSQRPVSVFYYVFDLLYLDGYDVRALSTRGRKRLLTRALHFDGPLRYVTHRNRDGEALYAEACRHGWRGYPGWIEGLITPLWILLCLDIAGCLMIVSSVSTATARVVIIAAALGWVITTLIVIAVLRLLTRIAEHTASPRR